MAFLLPAAAAGAGTSLATGLTLGSTIGLKAGVGSSLLAPTLGATLPTGSLLTGAGGSLLGGGGGSLLAGGAGLGGLGGAGGLLGGSSALLPKFASLGGAGGLGGSLLTPAAGGIGGALTPTGLASLQMPAGSLLKGGTTLASQISPTLASGAYNPAYAEMLGKQFAANAFPAGSPEVAKTMLASTDKIAPMAFKPSPSAQFLNTFQEGAAIPGVTSNLTPQTFGNIAGGPAIPNVTSALPVSATQTSLVPGSVSPIESGQSFLTNLGNLIKNPSMDAVVDYAKEHPYATAGAAYGLYNLMKPKYKAPEKEKALIRPYEFERTQRPEAYAVSPISDTSERTYFTDTFTPLEPYEAPGPEYKRASGGIVSLAVGGPVEQMAAMNAVGANTGYPMSGINTPMYSNPMIQRPEAVNVISPSGDAGVTAYSGEPKFAGGGIADLGGYSDGGRLLRGPGDGVSDSIPAVIGQRQPARLADGEFVVPARIVSELGNGSTEAGARKLYAMMDRVQKARRKTVGKDRVATNTRADKHLPA